MSNAIGTTRRRVATGRATGTPAVVAIARMYYKRTRGT
jgi:hypothetical protein